MLNRIALMTFEDFIISLSDPDEFSFFFLGRMLSINLAIDIGMNNQKLK
jgi:hypothetical protein